VAERRIESNFTCHEAHFDITSWTNDAVAKLDSNHARCYCKVPETSVKYREASLHDVVIDGYNNLKEIFEKSTHSDFKPVNAVEHAVFVNTSDVNGFVFNLGSYHRLGPIHNNDTRNADALDGDLLAVIRTHYYDPATEA
jgi:hypothetical protein